MKIIGISLRKNELYYAVLEGKKRSEAQLVEMKKLSVRNYESIPDLMNWFDSNFKELIIKFKPNRVAYKLHLNTNKEQMTYLQFPMGVLNLVCHIEGVPTTERSTSYITAQRKTIANNYFKQFKEGLKDPELDALVAAWNEME